MNKASVFLLLILSIPFVPPRSMAQTDSLHIHFRLQGATTYYSFQTTIAAPGGPYSGSTHSGSINTDLDTRFVLPRTNSVCLNCGDVNGLSFTIDPVNRQITGLLVKYQMVEYMGYGVTVTNYQIQFPALAYTEQGSKINAGSQYCKATSDTLWAMYESSTPNGMETGSWGLRSTPTDSLGLEIITTPGSADVNAAIAAPNQSLAVWSDVVGNSLQVLLPSSATAEELDLIDMMGRTVLRLRVPPGNSELDVSLAQIPSGCYFARMGTQVAKFVVPLR
ncbi:MAG: hypothetical protein Q8922_13865 [Bacteroidota bacterium]|nr:hypothetical protein [Bacteroidota bacterium]MDP4232356.1 hypothetical protein [Bacteroidota bacterium]MDP4241493.1 hypothetical protein [Bacteroidota bacterium]MDP4289009.1 hypothetical protein [Bacteroidota bacterium]